MRRAVFIVILLAFGTSSVAQENSAIEAGKSIAEANCSRCHSIGADDIGAHLEAPAFRTLSERYTIDALQEAFAEGVYVGHKDMPVFELDPADIDDLLAYVQSVQEP